MYPIAIEPLWGDTDLPQFSICWDAVWNEEARPESQVGIYLVSLFGEVTRVHSWSNFGIQLASNWHHIGTRKLDRSPNLT